MEPDRIDRQHPMVGGQITQDVTGLGVIVVTAPPAAERECPSGQARQTDTRQEQAFPWRERQRTDLPLLPVSLREILLSEPTILL